MHYAFNCAFTLTTLLSYQAVAAPKEPLEAEEIVALTPECEPCLPESLKDS